MAASLLMPVSGMHANTIAVILLTGITVLRGAAPQARTRTPQHERWNAGARSIGALSAQLASRLWHEAAHVRVAASMALDDAHVTQTAAALAPVRTVLATIVERGQASGALRTDLGGATLARLIESSARMVLRDDLGGAQSASLAVRAVLGVAGLSWREAETLLAAHPELEKEDAE